MISYLEPSPDSDEERSAVCELEKWAAVVFNRKVTSDNSEESSSGRYDRATKRFAVRVALAPMPLAACERLRGALARDDGLAASLR